jgi:hypothetical protein
MRRTYGVPYKSGISAWGACFPEARARSTKIRDWPSLRTPIYPGGLRACGAIQPAMAAAALRQGVLSDPFDLGLA